MQNGKSILDLITGGGEAPSQNVDALHELSDVVYSKRARVGPISPEEANYEPAPESRERLGLSTLLDSMTTGAWEPPAGEYIKAGPKNFAGSFLDTVADMVEAPSNVLGAGIRIKEDGRIGLWDEWGPYSEPNTPTLGRAIAGGLRNLSEKFRSEDVERAPDGLGKFLVQDMPQASGSSVAFLAGGAALGAAGIPEVLATAGLGAAVGGNAAYREARAHGAGNVDAFKSLVLNSVVGLSEAAPIADQLSRVLGRADALSGGLLRKALLEGGEEFIQESGQQLAGNWIAAALVGYDQDRELMDGVLRSGAAGALSGAFQSALATRVGDAIELRRRGELIAGNVLPKGTDIGPKVEEAESKGVTAQELSGAVSPIQGPQFRDLTGGAPAVQDLTGNTPPKDESPIVAGGSPKNLQTEVRLHPDDTQAAEKFEKETGWRGTYYGPSSNAERVADHLSRSSGRRTYFVDQPEGPQGTIVKNAIFLNRSLPDDVKVGWVINHELMHGVWDDKPKAAEGFLKAIKAFPEFEARIRGHISSAEGKEGDDLEKFLSSKLGKEETTAYGAELLGGLIDAVRTDRTGAYKAAAADPGFWRSLLDSVFKVLNTIGIARGRETYGTRVAREWVEKYSDRPWHAEEDPQRLAAISINAANTLETLKTDIALSKPESVTRAIPERAGPGMQEVQAERDAADAAEAKGRFEARVMDVDRRRMKERRKLDRQRRPIRGVAPEETKLIGPGFDAAAETERRKKRRLLPKNETVPDTLPDVQRVGPKPGQKGTHPLETKSRKRLHELLLAEVRREAQVTEPILRNAGWSQKRIDQYLTLRNLGRSFDKRVAAVGKEAATHERALAGSEAAKMRKTLSPEAREELLRTESGFSVDELQEALRAHTKSTINLTKMRSAAAAPRFSKARTQTKAFRSWFGGSKVVDESGKPLVVYHGTVHDFETFKRTAPSWKSSDNDLGFFFTPDPKSADIYSLSIEDEDGAKTVPVYLSIKNPKRFAPGKYPLNYGSTADAETVRKDLIARGYDGVHSVEVVDGRREEVWVAFHPEQIKSATGNRGTFDAKNPDIRYSKPRLPHTRAFQEFIGNTKTRDESTGEVIPLFHGTRAETEIESFDANQSEQYGKVATMIGAHLAEDPRMAETFSHGLYAHDRGNNPDTIPVWVDEKTHRPVLYPTPDSPLISMYSEDRPKNTYRTNTKPYGHIIPLWVRAEHPLDLKNKNTILKVVGYDTHFDDSQVAAAAARFFFDPKFNPTAKESFVELLSRTWGLQGISKENRDHDLPLLFDKAYNPNTPGQFVTDNAEDAIEEIDLMHTDPEDEERDLTDAQALARWVLSKIGTTNWADPLVRARGSQRSVAREIVQALKKAGYDSIKYTNTSGAETAGIDNKNAWIIPDESLSGEVQMKSAIGNTGSFSRSDKRLRYSKPVKPLAKPDKLGFYSALEDLILRKMGAKASAHEVMSMISNGGVKAEEIKWTGIKDFLTGKTTVTKQEVLDWIKEHDVGLTEKTLGGVSSTKPVEVINGHQILRLRGRLLEAVNRAIDDFIRDTTRPNIIENYQKIAEEIESHEGDWIFFHGPNSSIHPDDMSVRGRVSDGIVRSLAFSIIDSVDDTVAFFGDGDMSYEDVMQAFHDEAEDVGYDVAEAFSFGSRDDEAQYNRSGWVTPGPSQNYRELLFHIATPPDRVGMTEDRARELGLDFYAPHFHPHEKNLVAHMRVSTRKPVGEKKGTPLDRSRVTLRVDKDNEFTGQRDVTIFVDGAFAGAKGATRMTDEQIVDEVVSRHLDQKSMLFADEFQSDWHQQAGEKGYINEEAKKKIEEARAERDRLEGEFARIEESLSEKYQLKTSNIHNRLLELSSTAAWNEKNWQRGIDIAGVERSSAEIDEDVEKLDDAHTAFATAQVRLTEAESVLPEAPFRNWHELTMKRLIVYAAQEGHDMIGWTTGRQQIDRWNAEIAKNVKSISASLMDSSGKTKEEHVLLKVTDHNAHEAFNMWIPLKGKVRIHGEQYTLDSIVGRDLAKKIRDGVAADPKARLKFEGDDLMLGGWFHKTLYDEKLVQAAEAIGKKWGVSPRKAMLKEAGKRSTRAAIASDAAVWAMDIPPEMASAIKETGLARFSKRAKPMTEAQRALMRAEIANVKQAAGKAFAEGEETKVGSKPSRLAVTSDEDDVRAFQRGARENLISTKDRKALDEVIARAEAELEGDEDEILSQIMAKVRAGEILNQVETIQADKLWQREFDSWRSSKKDADFWRAMQVYNAYDTARAEHGRILSTIRDANRTLAGKVKEIVMRPSKETERQMKRLTRIRKSLPANDPRVQRLEARIQKLAEREAARVKQVFSQLDRVGINPDLVTEGYFYDPVVYKRFAQAVAIGKGTFNDGFNEWLMASLTSNPPSQIANITGNVAHTGYTILLRRFAEAMANMIVKDPNSPTHGENVAFFKAMLPSLAKAGRNLLMAYRTDLPVYELELHARGVPGTVLFGKEEENHRLTSALPWPLRGLRYPSLTSLMAFDEFFKTVVGESTAMAYAWRKAKQEGAADPSARARELLEDPDFWREAHGEGEGQGLQQARKATFQDYRSPGLMAFNRVLDSVDSYARFPVTRLFIPFRNTPFRIFQVGLDLPTHPFIALYRFMRGEYRDDPRLAVRDMAQTMISFGVAMAVMSLIDDPDDEDRPFITGTKSSNYGKATNQYAVAPPMSIKIRGTYYSYARIEPLATSLGVLVDLFNAAKREGMKEGGGSKTMAAAGAFLSSVVAQAGDKTFLQGLGEIQEMVMSFAQEEQSESSSWKAAKIVRNVITTPFVPRIVPGVIRAGDDFLRPDTMRQYEDRGVWDTAAVSAWRKALPTEANVPPPKYDWLGRPLKAGGRSWFERMFSPALTQQDKEDVSRFDVMVRRWNEQVDLGKIPEKDAEHFYPKPPDPWFERNGSRVILSETEYADLARYAGEMTAKDLSSRNLNWENPTPRDIRIARDAMGRARRRVKNELFKARGEGAKPR